MEYLTLFNIGIALLNAIFSAYFRNIYAVLGWLSSTSTLAMTLYYVNKYQ